MKGFTEIEYSNSNLDRYVIRTAIFDALKSNLCFFTGKLLDVGCGKMPYKDFILNNSAVNKYVGLDIDTAITYDENCHPDFKWDGNKMPFKDGSFECAFATEVLEHCPEPEIVLREVYRVLKKDGCFFFTVPFLWNLHEVPNDEYRYTPFSLERHLKNSGFTNIQLSATGGWHASMAQMLGLWVRRSPISSRKKKYLSYVFKPIIKYLVNLDKIKDNSFKDGQMITGLYGIVRK